MPNFPEDAVDPPSPKAPSNPVANADFEKSP